jgi:hypothetical protein
MVIFNPQGRLGNFMMEAFTAYSYAKMYGLEFTIPTESSSDFWNPIYFHHLQNKNYDPSLPMVEVVERQHNFQELPFSEQWRNKNIKLRGYFQTDLYFNHYRDEILRDFGFEWELIPNTVSIHCRRGDYLELPTKHPVLTNEYLSKAINFFKEKGYNNFLVFSDGIEWCKENINSIVYPECTFGYVGRGEGGTELQNMVHGSCCEHNIVSNGTFGWFQGWLNQNPNKIVVSPHEDNHFGYDNKHNDVSDYTPKSWHRIKYTPIYDLSIEEQNGLNKTYK